jgi:hypothetical protein
VVDDPSAEYAGTVKPLIYVDARDEDAITLQGKGARLDAVSHNGRDTQ